MFDAVFIGDEVSGAGWRLAGLRVLLAGDDVSARLTEACEEAALVLIGARAAAAIDAAVFSAVQRAGSPPVVVVPDVRGNEPPDLEAAITQAFGLVQ